MAASSGRRPRWAAEVAVHEAAMARDPLAYMMAAAGLLFVWHQVATWTTGFVASANAGQWLRGGPVLAPPEHLVPSWVAHGAWREGAALGASFATTVEPLSDTGSPSRTTVAGAALGLIVLAAAGARGRRQCQSSRVQLAGYPKPMRYTSVYGDTNPPKQPEWLLTRRDNATRAPLEFQVPDWLTVEKWRSFSVTNRRRSVGWYLMNFNPDGTRAVDNKGPGLTISEAIDTIYAMKERSANPDDLTLEVAMSMNLDPKYPDQQIRTSISLPHGTGKTVKVAVFCPEEDEAEVRALGAHSCGLELALAIEQEKIDFDILLAKPQMMPRLAKLGKILGPRRLMPSPKSGTVVQDYAEAIKAFKSGSTIELRLNAESNVFGVAGKLSMGREKLIDNVRSLLQSLADKRPAGAKKEFWKAVYIGSTNTPSVKLAQSDLPVVIVVDDEDD